MTMIYKATGSKIGISPGDGPTIVTGGPQWKANTVYPAGAIVVNGPFAFSTVAGGTSSAVANASGPVPNVLADGTVTWVLLGLNDGVQGAIAGLYGAEKEQKHELGTLAEVKDAGPDDFGIGEVEYVKFTGTVVAGDFVAINRFAKTCTQLPASPGANAYVRVGIALCSAASGQYGWVLVRGIHDTANVATGATADALVVASAAGRVTGTATAAAATNIGGAVIRRTGVANVGVVELFYAHHTGL